MTKAVAIYTRTNRKLTNCTVDRSLIDQTEQCITSAKNLYGDNAFIRFYHDDGVSGLATNPPALNMMADDIRTGAIDAVVVRDVSRLSRRPEQLYRLEQLCQSHGVQLVQSHGKAVIIG
jgi:DNA invertase Pin-like site-specific DNA recombinase